MGRNDLQIDWPKLSTELGLENLTSPPPGRRYYVTIGPFKIDGESSDWTEYEPIITDIKGDSKRGTLSTDLKAVYTVADADYLYVMIQLWDKPDLENDYIFPVDLNGDGQWEYSFGFNLDNVWIYDLRGIPRGQWPRDRQPTLWLPHEIKEVAEIAIPLSITERPRSITIQVWINNRGATVDETTSGIVPFISKDKPATTKSLIRGTTESKVSSSSSLQTTLPLAGPVATPPVNILLVAGVIIVLIAVVLSKHRKENHPPDTKP